MSIDRGMDKKMWYIYTMEYYSVIEKNKIIPFAEIWVDLETVIWNEVSQEEKMQYNNTSIWNLEK